MRLLDLSRLALHRLQARLRSGMSPRAVGRFTKTD